MPAERLFQADGLQRAQALVIDADGPRAVVGDMLLLDDRHRESGLAEKIGQHEPAGATPYDCDIDRVRHGLTPGLGRIARRSGRGRAKNPRATARRKCVVG